MEQLNNKNNNEKLSKIGKIMEYYCKELYSYIKNPEKVENRKIYIDLNIKYISYHNKRSEYKVYIKPKKGLAEVEINNPGVFFLFSIIHGFIPIIDKIIISNSGKKIDITKYKNFVLINRLFHLFFIYGFNFVTYDAIHQLLKNNELKSIFEENNIEVLNSSEVLNIISILEDIKRTSFDLHKHHFSKNLGKLNNNAIVSENIFLEVAMKFENYIREIIGFEHTYIKPASFDEDTKSKTDFIWIYSKSKNEKDFKTIPIQLTLVNGGNKFEIFRNFFGKSGNNEMIYININGKIKNELNKISEIYFNWAESPLFREEKETNKFPFFINEIEDKIEEFLIMYICLHQIKKCEGRKNITTIDFNLNGINFKQIKFNILEIYKNSIKTTSYTIKYLGKEIGTINILKLNKNIQINKNNKRKKIYNRKDKTWKKL